MTDLDELEALLGASAPAPWWISENDGSWRAGKEGESVDVGDVDLRGADEAAVLALRNAAPALIAELRAGRESVAARPLDEWHEDIGDVLWWSFPVVEPPHVGSPLDDGFPWRLTHWTPIAVPVELAVRVARAGRAGR